MLLCISGVYKTEIDPLQPKVTIVGNVEPQTLMRKLLKVGKQAEIWSSENQNTGKEKKGIGVVATREQGKEILKAVCNQNIISGTTTISDTDKMKKNGNGGEEGISKSSKGDPKDTNCKANVSSLELTKIEKTTTIPHQQQQQDVACVIHPSTNVQDNGKVRIDTRYCCMVEPCTHALHAIHSCHGHCHCRGLICQPLVQMPAAKVGDYFSDENTSGCHVM
ncbi:hypothetical protein U1Q18_012653 [Sarracenia purpurea var. burkii]